VVYEQLRPQLLFFYNYPLFTMTTICNHQLPLAVYREVAAHLQQIEGITVEFLAPINREFSYTGSQLGGLKITGVDRLTDRDRLNFDRILTYYANQYDDWESIAS
jgi:hypothetical protein